MQLPLLMQCYAVLAQQVYEKRGQVVTGWNIERPQ